MYSGMDQLYEKLKTEQKSRGYDVTLIFGKKEDLDKISKKRLFENCYLVEIIIEYEYEGLLEISSK
jgi:hypothetical protein